MALDSEFLLTKILDKIILGMNEKLQIHGIELDYATSVKDKFELMRKISKKVEENYNLNNNIAIVLE